VERRERKQGTEKSITRFTKLGALYVWGWNYFGQLGLGHKTNVLSPTLLLPSGIKEVASGTCHSLAQAKDGTLYAWGANDRDQILGEDVHVLSPKKFPFTDPVVSFGCGRNHSFLVTQHGKLFLFGDGREGQLGRPNVHKVSQLEEFLDWEVLTPTGGRWLWMQWMFMGKVDNGSSFYGIPVEVIFHFVKIS
jgi:alpha-tubulin suppressor-like RCC1 family protein